MAIPSLMMRPPRVIHNWFVVDDVRPYNHVWLSHCGRCAPQATLNRRSPAQRNATRKGNGAAISQPKVEGRSCFTLVNDIGSTAQTVRTPGNSVGVAISQPRVEVRSASTLGIGTKKGSNAEPKVTGAAHCDAER